MCMCMSVCVRACVRACVCVCVCVCPCVCVFERTTFATIYRYNHSSYTKSDILDPEGKSRIHEFFTQKALVSFLRISIPTIVPSFMKILRVVIEKKSFCPNISRLRTPSVYQKLNFSHFSKDFEKSIVPRPR